MPRTRLGPGMASPRRRCQRVPPCRIVLHGAPAVGALPPWGNRSDLSTRAYRPMTQEPPLYSPVNPRAAQRVLSGQRQRAKRRHSPMAAFSCPQPGLRELPAWPAAMARTPPGSSAPLRRRANRALQQTGHRAWPAKLDLNLQGCSPRCVYMILGARIFNVSRVSAARDLDIQAEPEELRRAYSVARFLRRPYRPVERDFSPFSPAALFPHPRLYRPSLSRPSRERLQPQACCPDPRSALSRAHHESRVRALEPVLRMGPRSGPPALRLCGRCSRRHLVHSARQSGRELQLPTFLCKSCRFIRLRNCK